MNFIYKFHQRCSLIKTIRIFDKSTQKSNQIFMNHRCPSHNFHTSSPRQIHPILIGILRPLSRFLVAIIGRNIRKWWKALPKNKKLLIRNHFKKNSIIYVASSGALGAIGIYSLNSHMVEAPYTHRKRLMFFDSSQTNILSRLQYQQDLIQYKEHIYPDNHPTVNRVKRICRQLVQANGNMPELCSKYWTLIIVDSPVENCTVYPTGQIVMFTGMLNLMDNDHQLAIILAHELSHVILEHNAEKLTHGSLIDILMMIPLTFIWALLPSFIGAFFTQGFFSRFVEIADELPYSRTLESEADELGLSLAAAACFDVREASVFWGRLKQLDAKRNSEEIFKDFLSTHPSHENRQNNLDMLMPTALQVRDMNSCSKLSRFDPRVSVKAMQELVRKNK